MTVTLYFGLAIGWFFVFFLLGTRMVYSQRELDVADVVMVTVVSLIAGLGWAIIAPVFMLCFLCALSTPIINRFMKRVT